MRKVKAGCGCWPGVGPPWGPRLPRKKAFTVEPSSPGMSLPGEILDLPQLLADNLWLGSSMSAEPGPKSLWFPGVTTTFCSEKVNQIVLALSTRTTSGLHWGLHKVTNMAPPLPLKVAKTQRHNGCKEFVHSLISPATLRQVWGQRC